MEFKYPPGTTPLAPDEVGNLLLPYITTQGELNAAEQKNIALAEVWLFAKRHQNILVESFLKKLHKKMFENVWKWAGVYRIKNTNIGVDWPNIPEEIYKLIEDTKYWTENQTYVWDELGARFHHRLVTIHPFSNGNGRHGRLMTDALLIHHGQKRFSWGKTLGNDFSSANPLRKNYLDGLRQADQKNFKPLIAFVRS